MNNLEKAIEISKKAHQGQKDKAGKDYFNHPQTVASLVHDEKAKIVAYLHDVIEDTKVTLELLIQEHFDADIIEAIDILTRKTNESYDEYIQKVSLNRLAKEVKIADLRHNSDLSRIQNPTSKDIERCQKYKKYIEILTNDDSN